MRWSETENIGFRVALPGSGSSTPIVCGDRIFITAAVPFGAAVPPVPDNAPGAHDNAPITRAQRFVVLALDRRTGRTLWERTLRRQLPHAGAHKSSDLAAPSPCTDGTHLFAFFGSYGLYCLDLDGNPVWDKDLGDMQVKHGHGEGASPALSGDTLVVNWDHEGDSFVAAFDKATGKERWRVPRDEVTSWSTPLIVEHAGKAQVIVSGTRANRAYDLRTGAVVWECAGLSHNIVASPLSDGEMVFLGSSYERKRMLGIRLRGAAGNIDSTGHIVWRRGARTPYVPSPVLIGDWLYFLTHYQGFLSRVHAPTGAENIKPLRLPEMPEIYASPVAAAGRIYVTDRAGTTVVVEHDPGTNGDRPFRVLARNTLDDGCSASAAIAGDEMFLRGRRYLYCLRRKSPR